MKRISALVALALTCGMAMASGLVTVPPPPPADIVRELLQLDAEQALQAGHAELVPRAAQPAAGPVHSEPAADATDVGQAPVAHPRLLAIYGVGGVLSAEFLIGGDRITLRPGQWYANHSGERYRLTSLRPPCAVLDGFTGTSTLCQPTARQP